MSKDCLSRSDLRILEALRGKPIDPGLLDLLVGWYGADGEIARLTKRQDEASAECGRAGTEFCDCGYCEPYLTAPALDAALRDIQAFERGEYLFDEEGELVTAARDGHPSRKASPRRGA